MFQNQIKSKKNRFRKKILYNSNYNPFLISGKILLKSLENFEKKKKSFFLNLQILQTVSPRITKPRLVRDYPKSPRYAGDLVNTVKQQQENFEIHEHLLTQHNAIESKNNEISRSIQERELLLQHLQNKIRKYRSKYQRLRHEHRNARHYLRKLRYRLAPETRQQALFNLNSEINQISQEINTLENNTQNYSKKIQEEGTYIVNIRNMNSLSKELISMNKELTMEAFRLIGIIKNSHIKISNKFMLYLTSFKRKIKSSYSQRGSVLNDTDDRSNLHEEMFQEYDNKVQKVLPIFGEMDAIFNHARVLSPAVQSRPNGSASNLIINTKSIENQSNTNKETDQMNSLVFAKYPTFQNSRINSGYNILFKTEENSKNNDEKETEDKIDDDEIPKPTGFSNLIKFRNEYIEQTNKNKSVSFAPMPPSPYSNRTSLHSPRLKKLPDLKPVPEDPSGAVTKPPTLKRSPRRYYAKKKFSDNIEDEYNSIQKDMKDNELDETPLDLAEFVVYNPKSEQFENTIPNQEEDEKIDTQSFFIKQNRDIEHKNHRHSNPFEDYINQTNKILHKNQNKTENDQNNKSSEKINLDQVDDEDSMNLSSKFTSSGKLKSKAALAIEKQLESLEKGRNESNTVKSSVVTENGVIITVIHDKNDEKTQRILKENSTDSTIISPRRNNKGLYRNSSIQTSESALTGNFFYINNKSSNSGEKSLNNSLISNNSKEQKINRENLENNKEINEETIDERINRENLENNKENTEQTVDENNKSTNERRNRENKENSLENYKELTNQKNYSTISTDSTDLARGDYDAILLVANHNSRKESKHEKSLNDERISNKEVQKSNRENELFVNNKEDKETNKSISRKQDSFSSRKEENEITNIIDKREENESTKSNEKEISTLSNKEKSSISNKEINSISNKEKSSISNKENISVSNELQEDEINNKEEKLQNKSQDKEISKSNNKEEKDISNKSIEVNKEKNSSKSVEKKLQENKISKSVDRGEENVSNNKINEKEVIESKKERKSSIKNETKENDDYKSVKEENINKHKSLEEINESKSSIKETNQNKSVEERNEEINKELNELNEENKSKYENTKKNKEEIKQKSTNNEEIINKSVEDKQIRNKSVEDKQIRSKSVDENQIKNKSVDENQIKNKSVDENQIKNKSVDENQIKNKSVDENHFDSNKNHNFVVSQKEKSKEENKYIENNKSAYINNKEESITKDIKENKKSVTDEEKSIKENEKSVSSEEQISKSKQQNKSINNHDQNEKSVISEEQISKSKSKEENINHVQNEKSIVKDNKSSKQTESVQNVKEENSKSTKELKEENKSILSEEQISKSKSSKENSKSTINNEKEELINNHKEEKSIVKDNNKSLIQEKSNQNLKEEEKSTKENKSSKQTELVQAHKEEEKISKSKSINNSKEEKSIVEEENRTNKSSNQTKSVQNLKEENIKSTNLTEEQSSKSSKVNKSISNNKHDEKSLIEENNKSINNSTENKSIIEENNKSSIQKHKENNSTENNKSSIQKLNEEKSKNYSTENKSVIEESKSSIQKHKENKSINNSNENKSVIEENKSSVQKHKENKSINNSNENKSVIEENNKSSIQKHKEIEEEKVHRSSKRNKSLDVDNKERIKVITEEDNRDEVKTTQRRRIRRSKSMQNIHIPVSKSLDLKEETKKSRKGKRHKQQQTVICDDGQYVLIYGESGSVSPVSPPPKPLRLKMPNNFDVDEFESFTDEYGEHKRRRKERYNVITDSDTQDDFPSAYFAKNYDDDYYDDNDYYDYNSQSLSDDIYIGESFSMSTTTGFNDFVMTPHRHKKAHVMYRQAMTAPGGKRYEKEFKDQMDEDSHDSNKTHKSMKNIYQDQTISNSDFKKSDKDDSSQQKTNNAYKLVNDEHITTPIDIIDANHEIDENSILMKENQAKNIENIEKNNHFIIENPQNQALNDEKINNSQYEIKINNIDSVSNEEATKKGKHSRRRHKSSINSLEENINNQISENQKENNIINNEEYEYYDDDDEFEYSDYYAYYYITDDENDDDYTRYQKLTKKMNHPRIAIRKERPNVKLMKESGIKILKNRVHLSKEDKEKLKKDPNYLPKVKIFKKLKAPSLQEGIRIEKTSEYLKPQDFIPEMALQAKKEYSDYTDSQPEILIQENDQKTEAQPENNNNKANEDDLFQKILMRKVMSRKLLNTKLKMQINDDIAANQALDEDLEDLDAHYKLLDFEYRKKLRENKSIDSFSYSIKVPTKEIGINTDYDNKTISEKQNIIETNNYRIISLRENGPRIIANKQIIENRNKMLLSQKEEIKALDQKIEHLEFTIPPMRERANIVSPQKRMRLNVESEVERVKKLVKDMDSQIENLIDIDRLTKGRVEDLKYFIDEKNRQLSEAQRRAKPDGLKLIKNLEIIKNNEQILQQKLKGLTIENEILSHMKIGEKEEISAKSAQIREEIAEMSKNLRNLMQQVKEKFELESLTELIVPEELESIKREKNKVDDEISTTDKEIKNLKRRISQLTKTFSSMNLTIPETPY